MVGHATAAFGGVQTGGPHNGQQEDVQELHLQNLQKMIDMNDDSTPSREKDQSSKAHNELYESSSQVKREMHELPQNVRGISGQASMNMPINVSTPRDAHYL